jgi:hypothetical protein
MKTPFKLKSGNKSSFKNLGSSPIYQKPGGIKGEAIDHWNKYKSTKAKWAKAHDAAIDRLATNPKTANLPAKEFDALLDKTSKLYTKQAPKVTKDLVSKKPTSITSGTAKAMQNVPKQFVKKTTSKTLGKLATGTIRKGASRILGGPAAALAGAAYGAYKSGQKHSGGKAVKGQKTGVVAPDPKKSIFKKKDRY